MKTVIRKTGNTHFVIVPKRMLSAIGVAVNDHVRIDVERGKLVVTPLDHDPRAGWAEESKRLAEAGEDGLVWPEFGNKADKDWTW